ncbi:MAG: hypothetical protein KF851_13525 [Pirellulaceae bacterium]|nr:hypothetical protein [Pirellulaceae bacterium]
MSRSLTLFSTAILILVFTSSLFAVQNQTQNSREFEGTVVVQRKYGIVVAAGEERFDIAIPGTVAIEQVLTRPKFAWDLGLIRISNDTANNGDENDESDEQILELPISKPLYIEGWFAHRSEFERLWSGNKKTLVRYRLTGDPQNSQLPTNESLRLSGEILDINERNEATIRFGEVTEQIRLGDREAVCSGFTILDLRSDETAVTIDAEWVGDQWVAQSIRFRRLNNH